MRQPHEILGVPYHASEIEIKTAFRKLAHIHHPDKGGNEETFKEINRAYQDLIKQPRQSNPHIYGEQHQEYQWHYTSMTIIGPDGTLQKYVMTSTGWQRVL